MITPAKGRLLNLTLRVWRQSDATSDGEFSTYKLHGISPEMSFLEMLDVLNEQLIEDGESRSHSIMTVARASAARAG